jgi:hypothetical protein
LRDLFRALNHATDEGRRADRRGGTGGDAEQSPPDHAMPELLEFTRMTGDLDQQ